MPAPPKQANKPQATNAAANKAKPAAAPAKQVQAAKPAAAKSNGVNKQVIAAPVDDMEDDEDEEEDDDEGEDDLGDDFEFDIDEIGLWVGVVKTGEVKSITPDPYFVLRISSAALPASHATKSGAHASLIIKEDDQRYTVATLIANSSPSVTLDLFFVGGRTITFEVEGNCDLHLTGYSTYHQIDEDEDEDDFYDEEDEEVDEFMRNRGMIEGDDEEEEDDDEDDEDDDASTADLSKRIKVIGDAEDDEDDDEDDEDDSPPVTAQKRKADVKQSPIASSKKAKVGPTTPAASVKIAPAATGTPAKQSKQPTTPHVSTPHPSQSKSAAKTATPSSSVGTVKCTLCSKTFKNTDGMNMHMKQKHANE